MGAVSGRHNPATDDHVNTWQAGQVPPDLHSIYYEVLWLITDFNQQLRARYNAVRRGDLMEHLYYYPEIEQFSIEVLI